MGHHVDVYYALQSPWTYLGWPRLQDIIRRTRATAAFKPVMMGRIFQASGGLPLAQRPIQRQRYRLQELERWKRRLKLPLVLEPRFFPVDESRAARMVIAHREAGGDAAALSFAFMRAVWADERDIANPAAQAGICREAGVDAAKLAEAAEGPAVAEIYARDTEEAVERGVFGAPFFIVGDKLFWGQDRLDFLEEALAAA